LPCLRRDLQVTPCFACGKPPALPGVPRSPRVCQAGPQLRFVSACFSSAFAVEVLSSFALNNFPAFAFKSYASFAPGLPSSFRLQDALSSRSWVSLQLALSRRPERSLLSSRKSDCEPASPAELLVPFAALRARPALRRIVRFLRSGPLCSADTHRSIVAEVRLPVSRSSHSCGG